MYDFAYKKLKTATPKKNRADTVISPTHEKRICGDGNVIRLLLLIVAH